MSFRCSFCHACQPPGTRPVTVTTARRDRVYTTQTGDPIPGWEIAAEALACPSCAVAPPSPLVTPDTILRSADRSRDLEAFPDFS